MRINVICCLVVISCCAANAAAAFSTAPGYTAEELYISYTVIGGLALDAEKLYFGQDTNVVCLDLNSNTVQSVGTLPWNIDIPVVARNNGITYASYGDSYDWPYLYHMGFFDESTSYINQLDEDGIFDYAINSSGQCYIVANPDAAGSKIFRYNWDDGNITEIADIGGYQGGLAFDSDGNLYYADQGDGEMVGGEWVVIRSPGILKFTAAQAAAGGLTADDAEVVLSITAGYIGFDADDNFYATTGWGATLAVYELDSQSKIEDVAYGGIGKFIIDRYTMYAIDTDWFAYAGTIQQIALPQPPPLVLAVQNIELAIESKTESTGIIDAALAKEREATGLLNALLRSGELDKAECRDIRKAKLKIRSAIVHQRIAKQILSKTVEELEKALAILAGEAEPQGRFEQENGRPANDKD